LQAINAIAAYKEADWDRDRADEATGRRLTCPNCDHGEWFHAVGVPPDTGAERKYRACKVCGFWQRADSTPAYRCRMTVHVCLGLLDSGTACEYCGAWGPIDWHSGCWRILPEAELGVTACKNCKTVLTRAHVIPWPVEAQ